MVERNKRRRQSEGLADELVASMDDSGLAETLQDSPHTANEREEESVADRARRTSEAAGLAHWTAPPTGHVPKVIGDRAPATQWDEADDPGWEGSDLAGAFSEPEPLTIDPTESTDGFGDRTRDPLADFAITTGPGTRDPLVDFVAVDPATVADRDVVDPHGVDPLGVDPDVVDLGIADRDTVDRAVVDPVGVDGPSSIEDSLGDASVSAQGEFEEQIDLTIEASPPEIPAARENFSDAPVSPANLRPKHRSVPVEKRTVFDLPPSEQLGAARSSADVGEDSLTVAADFVDLNTVDDHDETAPIGDLVANPDPGEVSPPDVSIVGSDADNITPTPHENRPSVVSAAGNIRSRSAAEPGTTAPTNEVDSTEQVETPPATLTDSAGSDDDAKAKGPGRNLVQATSVGVVLAVAAGVAIWLGAAATAALITLFGVLAIMEFYDAMRHAGLRPASLLGMIGVASIQLGVYFQGANAYPLVAALTVVFGVLWYLVGADRERPVLNLGLTMMGLLWVGGLAGFGVLIVTQEGGAGLFLTAIIITVASDTLAYVGGRSIGSTPFHPVSPNKTWEGTLVGFAGALLAGLAIGLIDVFPIFEGSVVATLTLAAVVGFLAPLGDLAESMMKRDLGVKDMGSLLPGHGGVMDRLDGLLFALPGAYYIGLLLNLF